MGWYQRRVHGVTLPSMAIKNINQLKSEDVEFTYRNNIGFGQTCQEHTVKVTGSANVSLEQKRRIQQSEEVRKCIRTTEKVQEIREELQRTRIGSQQQQQLEEQQQAAIQKKIDHCSQAIRKMSTLDQAKFRIEYTPMPQYVRQYTRVVDTAVKALLLSYLVRSETTPNQHNQIEVELKFNPQLETVDMVLKEEEETNQYANIRLPEQVRNMVPLVASKSIQEQLIEKIEGGSVYPTATLEMVLLRLLTTKPTAMNWMIVTMFWRQTAQSNQAMLFLVKLLVGRNMSRSSLRDLRFFFNLRALTLSPERNMKLLLMAKKSLSTRIKRKKFNLEMDNLLTTSTGLLTIS